MTINRETFNECVDLLTPHMNTVPNRQALVQSALFGCNVIDQIDWSGAARSFTVRLVGTLTDYGECEPGVLALVMLLMHLRDQVGVNQHARIDKCIHHLKSKEKTPMALADATLIGFLLDVGRWAKSELSERWKLRREQQETDLTDKAEAEAALPAQIESIAIERTPRQVTETTKLIERKRDAIFRARNAKLADREEYDSQRLSKAALEQRESDHDKLIRQMLNEIEDDLNDLGFEVDRTPA